MSPKHYRRLTRNPTHAETCPVLLHDLRAVSLEEVRGFASKSSCKSCNLNPLPVSVVKGCLDILLPVITWIVNLSLMKGAMPESFKLAELLPSLKKPDADSENFKNFRPISNLPMFSKVIEKAAADQFNRHVLTSHLDEPFQSAYKAFHSTETALVKVQNDILRAIDGRHSVILLLLDLSAAFDAVEHSILLSRLSTSFGITDTVLAWFRAYLTSRKQYVCVEGCKSSPRSLDRGVPQGSVLGSLVYLAYTSLIAKIIRRHDMQYRPYADDSQLYVSFKTESSDDLYFAKSKVELCVRDIDT